MVLGCFAGIRTLGNHQYWSRPLGVSCQVGLLDGDAFPACGAELPRPGNLHDIKSHAYYVGRRNGGKWILDDSGRGPGR